MAAPAHGLPTVRDARPDDLEVVVEFNMRLATETESKTLDRPVVVQGVKVALADPDRIRYWVAEDPATGQVIGQSAVTREWSDWRNGWIWWFQSVYIHRDYRGRGVFRALHTHIRNLALGSGDVIGLRLYVEAENDRAQRTYQALGMRAGGYHVYEEFWLDRFNSRLD